MTSRADPPPCWHALHLPKAGHNDTEYEDAWAADPARGRFALADGASESAFAGLWAKLLTEGFLSAHRPRELAGWLGDVRQRWSEAVMNLELPWYAEMKREEGSFSTFLGLRLRSGRWQAVAIGDTCLIRVRKDGRVRSFPLDRAVDFGNQPTLVRSRTGSDPTPRLCSGTLRPGERLLLMTDALAQWFLSRCEGGHRPWDEIAMLLATEKPHAAFEEWVDGLRGWGELHNDDVTLLSIG